MSFLDRFTSRKGKEQKSAPKTDKAASKKTSAEAADKKAFKAVPGGDVDKKKSEAAPVRKETTHQAYRVLVRPVVTEKSTRQQKQNQYTFEIAHQATKMDVRNAVHSAYGVRPVDVSIVRLPGKMVRYGRTLGRQAVRKKAVVTLPKGKSIDQFA